ncbi:hypothetical protein [Granulicella sp. dw_53]|uniref:hypothetical protein n=1 Tax=Granulicella sp. dw_53 TaxID=2719792 RepID=UPI001BD4BEAB|nr:hypothetical protein [Granulicella sp. dw_53]
MPASESQLRPLASLEPEEQRMVWRRRRIAGWCRPPTPPHVRAETARHGVGGVSGGITLVRHRPSG